MTNISIFELTDLYEGQTFHFETGIVESAIDEFARLTGDFSPIHMDGEFATRRGFEGRLAHGSLLTGLFSRLIGVHLPGQNSLLHSMRINFLSPTYTQTLIRVSGTVAQISIGAETVILNLEAREVATSMILAKGSATVVITRDI